VRLTDAPHCFGPSEFHDLDSGARHAIPYPE
jgi:hypothetical protein